MKITSNYLGNGKRYDGANGTDVAVSRGPGGEFMYDYRPMREHAAKIQRDEPRSTVRYICPRNVVAVAGFVPPEQDGTVIEFELGADGYLTKPVGIWYSTGEIA